MKIAICDDEKLFLSDLEQKIYSHVSKLDCEVFPFSSAEELLGSPEHFDLIFLDIEMGGMDGMSAARQIRMDDYEIPIVFLTSHAEMAIEGYEVNAFRFLKKPVEDEKLLQTLQDIQLVRASHKGVLIKAGGEEILVIPSEILFLESDNNNVRIITTSGSFTTRMKLGEAIDIFNRINDTIRKVHRCSAVNLDHVARLRDREAVLDDGSVIGISRSCFNEFKNQLYDHVKKTAR
ncbi:MAG: LytTR family DNA-binding domain-containing protein [Lachnospiraceae bacterium]|nr:LytTR family DNA-binding domain-containing protein [Lachnospiraceae bacterium]